MQPRDRLIPPPGSSTVRPPVGASPGGGHAQTKQTGHAKQTTPAKQVENSREPPRPGGRCRLSSRRKTGSYAAAPGEGAQRAVTGLVNVPMPSTVTATVWPGRIGPTPAGVPVRSTSPGSRVMAADM